MAGRIFSRERLVAARERAGLTQEAAAARAGLSRATIQNAEGGRNAPTLATLQRLASLYDYPLDWFCPAPAADEGEGNGTTATRRRARR